jgi:hypothetical protein
MDNLDNKVEITFHREAFEQEFRKLTDEQWVMFAEWIEQQCETNVWNKALYYINDWLDQDVEDDKKFN